jgi:hypothetical protein
MIWGRWASEPAFCALTPYTEEMSLSYCNTRRLGCDVVEIDDAPPHEQRRIDCCRVLVDRRCIELGLLELLSNTQEARHEQR